MNIKHTAIALLIIILALTDGSAFSRKRQDTILRKAIASYRGLRHSAIGWKVLGRSNWNNRIYYAEFGTGKKLTMIVGGMHGDEPCSLISTIRLAQYIHKNPSSIKNRVIIIPCLNPDGLMKGRRTNGHRVDINRNFPVTTWSPEYRKDHNNPGILPASEPETILLANAIDDYKPDLIIQMHQPFNTLYPDDNVPAGLIKKMSEITGLPVSNDIGYETPGSLGGFVASLEHKTADITYELCDIDREPNYSKVTKSLIEAINY